MVDWQSGTWQVECGQKSRAATPGFMLPSGNGTAIGATATRAIPMSCVIPILRAVAGDRSRIRPLAYGPRSRITTTAVWPVVMLGTLAVVPSGRVLLGALAACGSILAPSAIGRPAKL